MELNWTTFVLEIVNFLVLVWLLKRFFYQPVKDIIKQRQQGIEEQLQMAGNMQQEAEVLREKYENRLIDWEDERRSARTQLQHEIEQERLQLMDGLQQELDAERIKNKVLMARQAEEQQRQSEDRALEIGARFSAKLLSSVASREMQKRLVEFLMVELQQLPVDREEALLAMTENGRDIIVKVLSAYPLDEQEQQTLQNYLDSLLAYSLMYEYATDRTLLAGLRITVGPWVIHANLYDELKTFASIVHER
ncbi:F0F1 ATP synthase subunit delta [Desulfopila sp. IMCC35008]|uniref:F0F1 ATP synthase subunit delta n=1 Tax=Desulfopila sp. IMCC35008 TaxID=2653858 RepID=UPI0013D755D3|nr:F0F1 ATP synthase subunit delta [Desulfopila sp. IMCC35008]